jgi:hypothetical protein
MTATATTNGKPQRKQLSDQIDRLDTIIDALAEALPEAVADACREGARQAVKDAVVEILASPELRTLITGLAAARIAPPSPEPTPTPAAAEPAPKKPGFWTRAKARLVAAKDAAAVRCTAAATAVAATARTLAAVMPLKKILLVGTGIGMAVGVASYLCPHGLSAVVGGVGAACTAVGVQVGNWFRRSTRLLGFGGTG